MNKKGLAEELRQIRRIKGFSLREVENATKISNAYLSQLENGMATKPSPHKLFKLAEFYKVPYESLMKAAGYLTEPSIRGKKPSISASQAALMSTDLTEEESKLVVDYIKFLRKQKATKEDS